MTMARTQTMVQLNDELVRELDAAATREGTSRSAVIRAAVEQYLAAVRSADVGAQIVEGYRRIPPGVPDGWGDMAAIAADSTSRLNARLDAEEAAAGFEPW